MLVVGIAGKKRAGKNTVAEMVVDQWHGADVYALVVGFASLMKLSAMRALGFDFEEHGDLVALADSVKDHQRPFIAVSWYDERGVVVGHHRLTARRYLQLYGTEAHREIFGDDFWVRALFDSPHLEGVDLLVIPDVRFDNEAQAIRDRGGVVWEVIRDLEGVVDGHVSEDGLSPDLIDRVIDNQGTLDDLRNHVEMAAKTLPQVVAR
jgi:hypothetical protein